GSRCPRAATRGGCKSPGSSRTPAAAPCWALRSSSASRSRTALELGAQHLAAASDCAAADAPARRTFRAVFTSPRFATQLHPWRQPMKNRFLAVPLLALALLLAASIVSAAALGSAFTYQGSLNDGGGPATGLYDM